MFKAPLMPSPLQNDVTVEGMDTLCGFKSELHIDNKNLFVRDEYAGSDPQENHLTGEGEKEKGEVV
jgi:hypothetical protein